ncbi:hypothetical protein ACO22_07137 [Paracoccidioides brasiliensis]|uniref:Uncharacterized protein n=1 Tax=Paracoccidioides brasiliensis TaxID=121759 RepID=A0A1D2J5X0_PARBR|nr:hypothetical protein ACO22_07137 [Paracoccidioides brasiliensis]
MSEGFLCCGFTWLHRSQEDGTTVDRTTSKRPVVLRGHVAGAGTGYCSFVIGSFEVKAVSSRYKQRSGIVPGVRWIDNDTDQGRQLLDCELDVLTGWITGSGHCINKAVGGGIEDSAAAAD